MNLTLRSTALARGSLTTADLTTADLRTLARSLAAGAAAALLLGVLLHYAGYLAVDVLKAASGDTIVKPTNGNVISDMLATINGNALWLIVTGAGTAATVIGLALMFGVRDASNWAFRLAFGIITVFVIGPALVA